MLAANNHNQYEQRVLAVMAHPDDAEIFCVGAMVLLQRMGFEVHVATMTPGDCGSMEYDPSTISGMRLKEAQDAAEMMRASYYCVGCRDLTITYDRKTIRAVVEIVRQVRPSIVITHSPQDYLPDHELTSLVVRNACFAASAPNFDTGRRPAYPPSGRIPHLYYAAPAEGTDVFGSPVPCNLYVDVSEVIELKADLLACHKSQREWLRAQHGMDEYLDAMRRWCVELGRRAGFKYAEGFRQHLGHPYPQTDLLGDLLKPGVRGREP